MPPTSSEMSEIDTRLAIDGGDPVASEPIGLIAIDIGDEEVDAAVEVIRSGMLRQGPKCAELEQVFATETDAAHAFTTSNGTTALQLAYEALLEPGDEVLCPGYTFIATASMLIARGAVPVFCEIDPVTFNIDPEDAERHITSKTKAIVPVHLYGNPAPIDRLQSIAQENQLKVIYDAAQAHLARYNRQGLGTFGNAVIYSFYPTKNMTTGEGGMITVNDRDLARRIFLMRDHGMEPGKRYHHIELGYNYRMNDIAAAIGIQQFNKLPARTRRRRKMAKFLTAHLAEVPQVIPPTATPDSEHIYHQYTIRLRLDQIKCSRDEFGTALQAEGIGVGYHYPTALIDQPIIQQRVANLPDLPICRQVANEVICLPVHHMLTDEQVDQVAAAVAKVAKAMAT